MRDYDSRHGSPPNPQPRTFLTPSPHVHHTRAQDIFSNNFNLTFDAQWVVLQQFTVVQRNLLLCLLFLSPLIFMIFFYKFIIAVLIMVFGALKVRGSAGRNG